MEPIKETLHKAEGTQSRRLLVSGSPRTRGRAKSEEPIQALAYHEDTVLSEKRANETGVPVRRGLTQIVEVDRAAVSWHTADYLLC